MAERTIIWDVFNYIFEADRRRMRRPPATQARTASLLGLRALRAGIKPVRTYRNPIFLAREWAEAMEVGNFRSQRAFARAIGLSHARVAQVLGLLNLCPKVIKILEGFSDPMTSQMITERRLRQLKGLSWAEQKNRLAKIRLYCQK